MKKEKVIRMLVNLWKDQVVQIEKLAAKKRVSKAQTIRELVELGLKKEQETK